MADYTRKSASEWEWQTGSKQHGVRYFPKTQTLIWSAWQNTAEGPVFEPGISQTVADFLANGVSHLSPPAELLVELQAEVTSQPPKRRRLFGWLRK